jgi:putative aldouronate transport system substrate-binding protein
MNHVTKKNLVLQVVLCFLFLFIMGCKKQSASSVQISSPGEFPIVTKGEITLTWWQGYHPAHLNTVKSLNDVKAFQKLQEITGIKIQFQSPPINQGDEAFSTMVAARNIPDIMTYDIFKYPGGPTKAIQDKVIMDISDLIENYSPYVNVLFNRWPETRKDAKTDNGVYYMYPSFNDPEFMCTAGLMLRKDWLEELNLEVPETIDDWYNVLTVFKTKKGVIPFTMEKNYIRLHHYFVGAFDTTLSFWRDANTQQVKFGPVEPGFREFLEVMRKWYAEGLIDADFPTQSRQMMDAKILGDQAGSTGGFFGSASGMWLSQKKGEKFDLVFAPYPVTQKGKRSHFSNWQWPLYRGGGLISANNKYPKETGRMLDYVYSTEGSLLMNYGIEGDSYTMVNGYPTLTPKIINYSYSGSLQEALAPYTPLSGGSVFYQEKPWFEQLVLQYPAQKGGNQKFKVLESGKWLIPSLTFTDNENRVVSQYLNEINTYIDEMLIKFILGQEPLSNYDAFVANLEKMNYRELLAVYQSALDRYNNR